MNDIKQKKPLRELGLFACISLVIGNMVGSGIFLLPASLAGIGSISIFSWVATAIGALFLALMFAKLSHMLPIVGGPYAYCRHGLGNFVGFQVAFCYWIAVVVGNAATITATVSYLSVFIPSLGHNPYLAYGASMILLWVITGINIIGIREAKFVQVVTTLLKLLPLILIAILGLFFINADNYIPFNTMDGSNFSAIMAGSTLTMWAFIGLESATIPAEHVKNPQKTIARATIIGTLFTSLLYILSTVSVMGIIPGSILANSNAPFSEVSTVIFGGWGKTLIAIAAIISSFSANVGWVLLQGQIPLAVAEDGLFPKIFAKVGRKNTPYVGLIFSSLLITALMAMNYTDKLVQQFTFLITLSTLAFLIPYIFTGIAAINVYIRKRHQMTKKQLGFATFVALCAFTYSIAAIVSSGAQAVYYVFILLVACGPIFVFMRWLRKKG